MKPKVRQVLVVEDDVLQAQDIGHFIRGTGGSVLGPALSLEQGMALVAQADAAVLDINLAGHDVFPLADLLMERDIPIVFYTGALETTEMPRRFWKVPLIRKPIQTLSDAVTVTLVTSADGVDQDMRILLPKLRLAARVVYGDPVVADRLVERLLQDAIEHVRSGHDLGQGDARTRWLMSRMRRILRQQGSGLMN